MGNWNKINDPLTMYLYEILGCKLCVTRTLGREERKIRSSHKIGISVFRFMFDVCDNSRYTKTNYADFSAGNDHKGKGLTTAVSSTDYINSILKKKGKYWEG